MINTREQVIQFLKDSEVISCAIIMNAQEYIDLKDDFYKASERITAAWSLLYNTKKIFDLAPKAE